MSTVIHHFRQVDGSDTVACGLSTAQAVFHVGAGWQKRVNCAACLDVMDRRDTPDLDALVNEPTLFRAPVTTRTMHRMLTPEEDALVGHVRGYCHNSAVCRLCAAEGATRESTERWQEMYYAKAKECRDLGRQLSDARRRLDQVIGG